MFTFAQGFARRRRRAKNIIARSVVALHLLVFMSQNTERVFLAATKCCRADISVLNFVTVEDAHPVLRQLLMISLVLVGKQSSKLPFGVEPNFLFVISPVLDLANVNTGPLTHATKGNAHPAVSLFPKAARRGTNDSDYPAVLLARSLAGRCYPVAIIYAHERAMMTLVFPLLLLPPLPLLRRIRNCCCRTGKRGERF
jgi:hypothetical protein